MICAYDWEGCQVGGGTAHDEAVWPQPRLWQPRNDEIYAYEAYLRLAGGVVYGVIKLEIASQKKKNCGQ